MAEDVVLDVPSAEEIAQHYKAMGDSVQLIDDILTGAAMADETEEEKKDCVKRNVDHLEIMIAKDFWGKEDMKPSQGAIAAGKAFLNA